MNSDPLRKDIFRHRITKSLFFYEIWKRDGRFV